jgi:hypothetical protein
MVIKGTAENATSAIADELGKLYQRKPAKLKEPPPAQELLTLNSVLSGLIFTMLLPNSACGG